MRKLMAITMALSFALLCNGQTFTLNVKTGDCFKTEVNNSQTIIQQAGTQEIKILQKTEMTLNFSVLAMDDTTITIRMMYDRIRFEQKNPSATVSYDSMKKTDDTNPAVKQMSAMYDTLISQPFTIVLDRKTGHQVHMDGWDSFVDKLISKLPQTDSTDKTKFSQMLKGSVKEQMVSNNAAGLFPPILGQPATKGAHWSTSNTLKIVSNLNVNSTYTVADVLPGQILIYIDSNLSTPADAKAVEMGIAKMKYELQGSQKGTLIIDRKTGWVSESDTKQTLSGNMLLVDQNFSIPIKVTSTTKLRSEQVPDSTEK